MKLNKAKNILSQMMLCMDTKEMLLKMYMMFSQKMYMLFSQKMYMLFNQKTYMLFNQMTYMLLNQKTLCINELDHMTSETFNMQ